jgi:hypothetical protein
MVDRELAGMAVDAAEDRCESDFIVFALGKSTCPIGPRG